MADYFAFGAGGLQEAALQIFAKLKGLLDKKAGKAEAAGYPLLPNFDKLTPKATYTYTVADTSAHEICARANTGLSDISDFSEVVLFRVTVTGSGIEQVTDFLVQGSRALTSPMVIANNRTLTTTAATSGIRYVYFRSPKALNSGYGWALDFACYNATARTVKVEVYADTDAWTWRSALTASSYDSNHQASATLTTYTSRGIVALGTVPITVNTSATATYITGYLPRFNGAGTQPVAGEALSSNALIYYSGNKAYMTGNKTKPINPEQGLAWLSSAITNGSAVTYNYARMAGSWSALGGDSGLSKGTLARGNPVYLRCTMAEGNIYSDAYLSAEMETGYTWCYIGTAQSNTAINLDATHPLFLTLDASGKLTHVNGREIKQPDVPVQSVNGQIGAVTLSIPTSAADVGAEPAGLGVTGAPAGALLKASAVDANGKPTAFAAAVSGTDYAAPIVTVIVSGTTPTITAEANHRYVCGEVATLDLTPPASGICDVVFSSGTTATVLTVTPAAGQTVTWAGDFDPTSLDASTKYELNILDGMGVAASWTT